MIVEIAIETLVYGGAGLGRHDGKAIFVPGTAPGDVVRCRLVREKKRHAHGELLDVLSSSPLRREPPCPVFGRCGGCQWQHLPYPRQAEWKERIFCTTLERAGALPPEGVRPLVPVPDEWEYRSRAQFKCRQTESGFVMGFYRGGSHFVIDIARCPILEPRLNEALTRFRVWLATSPAPDQVPQVDVGVGDDGNVRAVVHVLNQAATLGAYLQPLAAEAGYALFLQQGRKEGMSQILGPRNLELTVGDPPLVLGYGPGGFAQVNLAQNRALVGEVVALAAELQPQRVLDLYCGMGNFSLPLARCAESVVGVEEYAPAIAAARDNARRNGVANAAFHARPAEETLKEFAEEPFDLVVLDPPRSGAYPVMRELLEARPAHILYVSCDPPTLARDLAPLLHGGYRLCRTRPFDLFPQTYHIESVTLLSRG
jgi:23S rRNA (uracil1939-C5)-methyltransferase